MKRKSWRRSESLKEKKSYLQAGFLSYGPLPNLHCHTYATLTITGPLTLKAISCLEHKDLGHIHLIPDMVQVNPGVHNA